MSIFAAVMTGKGTGAIATVQVFGEKAESLLKKIFKPAGGRSSQFKAGAILIGSVINGTQTIDQVTIGCEGENHFAINCHGNPLIIEDIMNLLERHGARIITPEQMLYKILAQDKSLDTIAIEAKLTIPKAKTIDGTKIIVNQTNGGLSGLAKHWLSNLDKIPLDQISADAGHILKASETASLIIFGCKAVIAGPPNTGKSTLLNRLAGRDAAIVSEIKGTTRDWVCAACQIGPLALELIDTAGLDETIAVSSVDKAAQQTASQLLNDSDIVLLVLDISETNDQLSETLIEKITGKKVLTILNKNDRPARFDSTKLPPALSHTATISAKLGTGIEQLCVEIQQLTGVENFDLCQPVCFTLCQKGILTQLLTADYKTTARSIITELLSGRLNV